MSRHVTIGTAGHVDHGKTALVKMLTGVDTDRWEEEKRRGITMDLGFAPLDLGDGLAASIVDVPGHEDFVRNMVAGATGIDVALLVVAADEGVMPQTVEHLAIVDLLGVRAGVIALTKSDLADDEWLQLVMEDVADRATRSAVQWEIPIPCSAVQREGRDDLLQALRHAAARAVSRSEDDLFRLPVDRVFSVVGAGTVVTGTTWSGSVGVGDAVRILPGGLESRVRSIQVHDQPRERAAPGRRTALALPDVNKAAFGRGAVVVADSTWRTTEAIDCVVTLLPDTRPLSQRSRVRVHLGTAEVMARVTPAEGAIAAGSRAAARLRLEAPIVARWGDRGVLRSYSPVTTIGGFVVADPFPPARPRRPRNLAGRAAPGIAERLGAFVATSPASGLPFADLFVRVGLHPTDLKRLTGGPPPPVAGLAVLEDRFVHADAVDAVRRRTLETLRQYHAEHPVEPGMPLERLRRIVGDGAVTDHAHRELLAAGALAVAEGRAKLPEHEATIAPEDRDAAVRLEALLSDAGRQGLALKELDGDIEADQAARLLEHLVRQGSARRLRDRYYRPEPLDTVIQEVVAEVRQRGSATPTELRERTGLTRKTLIPLLEWLDEQGITRRDGDARVLGPRAP